jgi:hypothetical protein
MGLLPGSSRGNTEKAVPGDKGGVENGAGRAMVVAMPRDGAIIFSDLIGKLDVLRVSCDKCGRDGSYPVNGLIEKRGRDAKLIDWLDELTADCIPNFSC